MDPVISLNAWFWTLSNVLIADFDGDDSVVDPYTGCGRFVPIYTFFNTASAAPNWVPASFLSKANLRLALAAALLMCVFQVCLLSMVIPRYVPLSSNIIFLGFDLSTDKVKSVVKDYIYIYYLYTSVLLLLYALKG